RCAAPVALALPRSLPRVELRIHRWRFPSLRMMMVVHRLDADASRTGHPPQVHAAAAEKAGLEPLRLDVHGNRGVLVEECAGFDQDAFPRAEPPLEGVAISVEDQ